MTTPEQFAEKYIKRNIYIPFIINMSGLLYLPDTPLIRDLLEIYRKTSRQGTFSPKKIVLNSLGNLPIDVGTRENIHHALEELTHLIIVDLSSLEHLNRDYVKKRRMNMLLRKKTVKYPECENEYINEGGPVLFPESGRSRTTKRPVKETELLSSWNHICYTGLVKKLVLRIEANRISEMLSSPITFKKRRVQQYFFKSLEIIICRYLHEQARFSEERAGYFTAKVMHEYTGRNRLQDCAV